MALTSALAAALLAQAVSGASPSEAPSGFVRYLLELVAEWRYLVAFVASHWRQMLELLSRWILALLIVGIPVYGYAKGVKVYEAFIEGAKEGFATGVRIIPYLVAILAAVGAFRASGAMDAFARVLAPVTGPLGLPAEVIPLAVVRPFSGGGALGILGSIFAASGPDSYAGKLASILQGSTETTFYVLSVYCGSVGIVRYRHALVAGLGADCTGLIASVTLARLLWG